MANIPGTTGNDTLFGDTDPLNLDDVMNSLWLAGDDQMIGGNGMDTYNINSLGDTVLEGAGQGIDTVVSQLGSYTLGANVENLVLQQQDRAGWYDAFGVYHLTLSLGAPTAMDGTGNDLANTITGNSNNNYLDGAAGADTISGGEGADTIKGGADGDTLNGDAGVDTLWGESGNDTLDGGDNDDNLYGGNGADSLSGGLGGDALDGGFGNDTLAGGIGNDRYYVDVAGDVIVEAAGAGIDTEYATVSETLDANVENLTLTSTAAINGTGNGLNNVIVGSTVANTLTGNGGNDTLRGNDGNDTLLGNQGDDELDGQAGIDFLTGGTGQDRFVFSSRVAGDVDTITDFNATDDTIVLADVLDDGLVGALTPGILGLSFVGGNVPGNTLAAASFNIGVGANGSGTAAAGIYVETNTGTIWYNPSSALGGNVAIGHVDLAAAATLTASDFVLG